MGCGMAGRQFLGLNHPRELFELHLRAGPLPLRWKLRGGRRHQPPFSCKPRGLLMKLYLICGFFCCIGFFAMAMQLGYFGNHPAEAAEETLVPDEEDPEGEAKPVEPKPVEPKPRKAAQPKKLIPVRAKFPQELAPAAKAIAVPIAAPFVPDDRPHKIVFFKATGDLHSWQETHSARNEEWSTTRVEDTELVVVVGG